jgi:hypothetical protein
MITSLDGQPPTQVLVLIAHGDTQIWALWAAGVGSKGKIYIIMALITLYRRAMRV